MAQEAQQTVKCEYVWGMEENVMWINTQAMFERRFNANLELDLELEGG
jgi:hypothetical protein